jgi:hypothetical protein
MELFGAVDGAKLEPDDVSATKDDSAHRGILKRVTNLGLQKKGSVDALRITGLPQGQDQTDSASLLSSDRKSPPPVIDESMSVQYVRKCHC